MRENADKNNFEYTVGDVEVTSFFLLYIFKFAIERPIHLSTLKDIDQKQWETLTRF